GTSNDNGRTWTYDGEALEENPQYCPTGDTTDDGEGHPNVITIGGNTYLYTLPRAAGDMQGVGMVVHQFTPTESNPLGNLPATESVGIDPDAFVPAGTTSLTVTTTSSSTIPLTSLGTPGSPEQLIVGSFIDLTQTPTGTTPTVITCGGLGTSSLTGCNIAAPTGSTTLAPVPSSLTIHAGDLIEQVIGFTTKSSDLSLPADEGGPIPAGPNSTLGTGGTASITVDPVQATVPAQGYTQNQFTNPLTGSTFNNNAPERLYLDGTAIYCVNADANPTSHIENCTTGGGGSPYTVSYSWEPITADPIVPASAYDVNAGDGMTNGLVAPDGIVGTLPSYPNDGTVPNDATYVMYTEKELGYFVAAETTKKGTFSTTAFTIPSAPGTYISQDLNLGSSSNGTYSGPFNLEMGATAPSPSTSTAIIPVTCSSLALTNSVDTSLASASFSGCTVPSADNNWTWSSNTYLGAPGAATVSPGALSLIGEGNSTNVSKLYKNNEDLSVLRVAWTTDGVNFSNAGLANGGIISGSSNAATTATGEVTCTASNATSVSNYQDINNPCSTQSPANLNAYAENDAANGTAPPTGGTDTGGVADVDEMRWVGSAGSIIDNNGTYELFLSGAWAADGDSDAFNQVFYSTSTDGENWSVPTPVISTDYSFAASVTQANQLAANQDDPLGISAYYSGRAYAPSVVQNPDGTLTMVFGADRVPKSITAAGTVIGTNASAPYTVGATDPALYRNILTVTLEPASSLLLSTTTTLTQTASSSTSVGSPVTYTATVTPTSSYAGPPTGTVSFATTTGVIPGCGAVALSQLTPDTATCSTTYSGAVDDLVQAIYGGDSLDAASENYATTSTTLSSSDSGSAVVGETVTYAAIVADQSGDASQPTPAGTVAFSDGDGVISNCADQSLGLVGTDEVATCSVSYSSLSSPDPDTVTASYSGDSATFPSTATLSETVTQAQTTTVVNATPESSLGLVVGQPVTYTASVSVNAPGSGAPTGSISLSDTAGAVASCTGLAVGGSNPESVSCTTAYTAAMADNVTATYSGDTNFAGSASTTLVETVDPASTTTVLSSPSSSIVVGQSTTFTAIIGVVAPGAGSPTGGVTFSDTAGVVGDACPSQSLTTVDSTLEATCTVTFQSALTSPDKVSASYNTDGNFASSTSSTIDLAVTPAQTTTTLEADNHSVVAGQPVTYTASVGVLAPGAGSPTGTVSFTGTNGVAIAMCTNVTVASAPSSPITASCTTSYASPGDETVEATYNSDGNYATSSAQLTESVSKDTTTALLTASPDPAVTGTPTVLTTTVLVNSPGASSPTGTVSFFSASSTLCSSVSLKSGASGETATCSVTYSSMKKNLQAITAVYSGDANEEGSTSPVLDLAVTHATHLNVVASPSPASYGQRVDIRANGLPGAATGTISVDINSTQLCSIVLGTSPATCTPMSPLAPGSYRVSAIYSGDSTYAPSSATTSLTVQKANTAITLRAVPQTSSYGAAVSLVASKIPALATGTVSFTFDGSVACTVSATSPSVSCNLPGPVPVGSYSVSASYSGDANFVGSSASATFIVKMAATHFSASATPASTGASQNVTLVASNLPVLATGTVTFTSGATPLCTASVSSGLATCDAPSGLVARTYHVTARYSGDTNYAAASATTVFTVTGGTSPPAP
ncbi:MAG: Ig-like domain-containing protein, partial [Acidimicrobiales bacterium]